MPGLLHGFLNDLLQHCRRLNTEVKGMSAVPPEVTDYWHGVMQLLERIEQRIQDMLQDPDIQTPALAKNYMHDYKRLAESIRALEWQSVLALLRYSRRDRLATLICQRISQEVVYPYTPPICVALSANHYWTSASHNLIGLPVVEPFHLLGLSDLYHEIGHILLFRNRESMEAPFLKKVDAYFDEEIRRVDREGRSPQYREELDRHRRLWKRYWTLEFASDMVAAYLAGPAYGWTNVRLCADLSTDPYADDPEAHYTHPADDARNTAICMMLIRIGHEETAEGIQSHWNQYIELTGQQRPQEYELRYPSRLLEQLLALIHQECGTLGLVSYCQVSPNPSAIHITALLNEAWEHFNRDPEQFALWEEKQVERLSNMLGT